MNNLLLAGIYRRLKDWLFWIVLGVSLAVGVFFGLNFRSQMVFDDFFVMPIFALLGVFIALSIGREYSDGTIRNKLIAGHTKGAIFVSELILNIISCSLIFVVYFGVFICLATYILPAMAFGDAVIVIIGYYLLNISFAVIFTVVSCLIPSRAIGVVVCMLLFVAMMVGSTQISFMLAQPEVTTIEHYDANENLIDTEEHENPAYIGGAARIILQTLDNALPYGQLDTYLSYMMIYSHSPNPQAVAAGYQGVLYSYPLYSLVLIAVLSGVGLLVFRKRDFK